MQPLVSEVQRISERINNMMVEVAREREALTWKEMLHQPCLKLPFRVCSMVHSMEQHTEP